MLHKRFKVAKCKTSLKLASSRIKLMKNKKGIQINQIKKDLAQLLESGQDRTARIRVEHAIREEKMVAAYELIEIYCELIVARLPIIESQKTCPIDLKEAITSVIFAAPRCSDIPELVDIQKHFTAKYGKDFITGAIELRPDCGVSRMLVEKLSAIAPDVQTKMKVLSAVAKEHNINWDPTSFEEKESKPPDDLLNGPANFEKAGADLPKIPTSNVQNVQSHEEKLEAPIDFSQQNKRYTVAPDMGGVQTPSASTTHDDTRSSGMGSERMNVRHSFNSNGDNSSSHRENWNMEFKDATSAAQAAAESAERASMAARAAAQLSTQEMITRQHSTESHDSRSRDETPRHFKDEAPRHFKDETPRHFKDSYNSSSYSDRNTNTQNQQTRPSEHDTKTSRNDSVDESLVNNIHLADGYVKSSSYEDRVPKKNQPKPGFGSGENESSKSTKNDYFAEQVIRKQPSISSSHSCSSTISDELDVSSSTPQKSDIKTLVGNPFAVANQGNVLTETTNTNSYVASRRDDENDSDDDGPRFDTGFEYDEGDAKSFFPSPGRESINALENKNTHIFSERRSLSGHSTKSVDPSVNFDHSDGPDSESESELTKPSLITTKLTSPRKNIIELNDLVEIETESSFFDREDEKKRVQSRQSSTILRRHESKKDDNEVLNNNDDSDTGNDLMFGRLTGGLRNKGGFKYPPYTKTVDALPEKLVRESPVTVDRTSHRSSFSSKMSRLDNKKPSVSMSSSDSDSDDYSDKFPVQSKNRPRFAPPDAFFNDNGTDSEEEAAPAPKPSTSRVHLGSGVVSRRTKGHVEPGGKTVISPTKESPAESQSYTENFKKEPTRIPESSKEKPEKHSYNNITQPDPQPDPVTNKQETPRKMPEPAGGTVISPTKESPAVPRSYTENFKKEPTQKPDKRSYYNETRPNPVSSKQEPSRKMPEPEASKTSNISSESSSGANNVKKPSHVHPKLPDYDSLAARIQSLRTGRQ